MRAKRYMECDLGPRKSGSKGVSMDATDGSEAYELEFDISALKDPEATLAAYVDYQANLKALKRRELYLWGGVSVESVGDICDMIVTYNRQDKNIPVDKRKPIYLHIFSGGGRRILGKCIA